MNNNFYFSKRFSDRRTGRSTRREERERSKERERERRSCLLPLPSHGSWSPEYFCFSEAVCNFLLKKKIHRENWDSVELLISEDIQFINKCLAQTSWSIAVRESTVRSPTLLESFIWWTMLLPDRRTENRSIGYNFTDSLQISSHWTEFCFIAIKH